MKNLRIALSLALAISAVVALTPSSVADVISVSGNNAVLESTGGNFYVPLTSTNTGALGVVGIGLSPDQIILTDGDSIAGWLELKLTFDLTEAFDAGAALDADNPFAIDVTARDIDFKPVTVNSAGLKATYRDTMQIAYLRDATDTPTAWGLTVDETNYLTYKTNSGVATHNTPATYRLDLTSILGLTQADVDDVNADKEFALYIRLNSYTEYQDQNRPGDSMTIDGAVKEIGANFEVGYTHGPIPEPMTISLLVLGGLAVLGRTRLRGQTRGSS